MKTKKINIEVEERLASIFVLVMGFPMFYLMYVRYPIEVGDFHDGAIKFIGGISILLVAAYIYVIYNFAVKLTGKYILTQEKIQATGKGGKIINEIYVSEIVQTGIVGEKLKVAGEQSEYFDMPRYIYLSKRVLTEDERKDILRAASDGSVLLFRYSDKLKYALNEICGIHVAG
ncbi:MAG: hypothetical protein IKM61_04010 [Eubacteriaceae bacterium]|nr:hypothetical protein [Eubacteriaceae bacterium]